MANAAHPVWYSFEDYLAFEESSDSKHEYLDGQIYGMAGGTREHAALAFTLGSLLFIQLRFGRCRAHSSDLRVRVQATGLTTYPDLTIVCGPPAMDSVDGKSVVNPTLLVEVLSPSTERYDRGEKLAHYKRIPSLRQVVLVGSTEEVVEVWTRDDADGWTSVVARPGEVAELGSIGATLDVREMYEAAQPGT